MSGTKKHKRCNTTTKATPENEGNSRRGKALPEANAEPERRETKERGPAIREERSGKGARTETP